MGEMIERFAAYSHDFEEEMLWPWTKAHFIEDRLTGRKVFKSDSWEETKAMLDALRSRSKALSNGGAREVSSPAAVNTIDAVRTVRSSRRETRL